MRKFPKIIAAFGVLAFAHTFVNAATAQEGGPNDAYCTSGIDDTTPWCGFSTFQQCEETASGTGADCVANVWRDERPTYGGPHSKHGVNREIR